MTRLAISTAVPFCRTPQQLSLAGSLPHLRQALPPVRVIVITAIRAARRPSTEPLIAS